MVGPLHHAAELRRHGLLAVADAHHRQAQAEHGVRRPGALALIHAGRPAGQDDALRREGADAVLGRVAEGPDLAIDAGLAQRGAR